MSTYTQIIYQIVFGTKNKEEHPYKRQPTETVRIYDRNTSE